MGRQTFDVATENRSNARCRNNSFASRYLAVSINETLGDSKLEEVDKKVLHHFAGGSRALMSPMATMFGNIVGQEVVKACLGKFHILYQFFYLNSVESLPVETLVPNDLKPENSRYDAQLQNKLEQTILFMVGSGALGCEFLKNLALMGISCHPNGELTVTDDDVIEKSNLSRQFLFRDWNIGQPKSTVAATAAMAINPKLHVEALQNTTSPETENMFNDAFWESLDAVVNALDNVTARMYIDSRCVYFHKSLLESGTLGVPHKDADGSFLHGHWNSDLKLFSNKDNGAYNLLQLFFI
jgi:ubiquitin-activating enzyme E1